MIPLTLKKNEKTGLIMKMDQFGNEIKDDPEVSDVLSYNGSEIIVNTRNSVPYKKYYND